MSKTQTTTKTTTKLGRGMAYVLKAFENSSPADIDSTTLERAQAWLEKNGDVDDKDGDSLLIMIEDELAFRNS